MEVLDLQMYIGGKWVDAQSGKKIEVTSPIDDQVIGYVPRGGKEDAVLALKAAKSAAKAWALLPSQTRAGYIRKLYAALDEHKEELARLLSLEQGKILDEARAEMNAALSIMDYAIGAAPRIEGDIIPSSKQDEQIWIQRVPYGVTVGLVSWNFPLVVATRKFANALVCGNTMVVKAPSITPLTILKFAQYAKAAGLPAGVLNFVTGTGSEMGEELVRNPITQMVSLTGSKKAGSELCHLGADNITVLRLELGGKAPVIVMDDADLDIAVDCAVAAKFTNCGQVCTCNDRMFIHKDIYDEFMSRFLARVKAIKVGSPFDPESTIGPKVSHDEVAKLEEMCDRAAAQGARLIYDGSSELKGDLYKQGSWFAPRVYEVDDNSIDIMKEETFGPVALAMKVDSLDQALEYANDSEFGLSAYLYTKNIKNVMRVANELEFGEIYMNRTLGEEFNAFHNGYKTSGMGGEDGQYGLEGYLQKKTVYLYYGD